MAIRRGAGAVLPVAIGSGVAPLVILWAWGDDRPPVAGELPPCRSTGGAVFGDNATVLGALTLNYFGLYQLHPAACGAIGTSAADEARRRFICRASWRRSC